MTTTQLRIAFGAAVLISGLGTATWRPAFATEDTSLMATCVPAAAASDACRFYIAGFLDGALLTDTAIISSLMAVEPGSDSSSSDYLARAYRTRVGELRGNPPPTALAEFCLPPDLTIDAAAAAVLPLLDSASGNSLQEIVYAAVKNRFPCRQR